MLTTLPVDGVSWTELRVMAKESIEVPGEGVKGTAASVTLTVALPPPPQLMWHVLEPLQDEKVIDASNRTGRNERVFLRFMRHPTTE